jgi:hypothetical protein
MSYRDGEQSINKIALNLDDSQVNSQFDLKTPIDIEHRAQFDSRGNSPSKSRTNSLINFQQILTESIDITTFNNRNSLHMIPEHKESLITVNEQTSEKKAEEQVSIGQIVET